MLNDLIQKRSVETIELIPKGYRSDQTIKETIRCVVFQLLREEGLVAVPAFRNPRFPEGPVDIAGVDPVNDAVKMAFSANPLVELSDVKSLERIEAETRCIITFSRAGAKVKQSAFFLKPGIDHIDLYGGEF